MTGAKLAGRALNTVRRSGERGRADHGWLFSMHSFAFADYYASEHVHFGPLRVFNEDWVAAGAGFGQHSHRDMEILSYPLEGELHHQDSLGNNSVVRPGDMQRMSAGTGVSHSEWNRSDIHELHFLQIWILPNVLGISPSYQQIHYSPEEKRGRLRLVVSSNGAEGSVSIHQDVRLYAGLFDGAQDAVLGLRAGRRAYVHVARGELRVNDMDLAAGDALKIEQVNRVTVSKGREAEVLVFDLPGVDDPAPAGIDRVEEAQED